MVEVTRGGRTTFVVRPNCSLNWRGLFAFYALVVLFSASIASIFAVLGYWPILPFAGLELVALGAALFVTRRRCDRCERIEVDERSIQVTARGRSHRLQTAWARVNLRRTGPTSSRLCLSSHGRDLEIGNFLTVEERSSLARQLRQVLAPRTAWAAV